MLGNISTVFARLDVDQAATSESTPQIDSEKKNAVRKRKSTINNSSEKIQHNFTRSLNFMALAELTRAQSVEQEIIYKYKMDSFKYDIGSREHDFAESMAKCSQ